MKTTKTLATTLAALSLPFLSFAQTATDNTSSPTSSADGGAQKVTTPEDPYKHGPTNGPATDAPKYSSTNTQTGGTVDTGTPKDNSDKNSNVEHQGATDTSTTTTNK